MSALISRARGGPLAAWWFTVDRLLLAGLLILIGVGVTLSLAAGTMVAEKKGLATYFFVQRHLIFAGLSLAILIAISLLTPAAIRRFALVLFVGTVIGLLVVLFGEPVNGARRWLRLGALSLQPSELMKPAFIVLSAWLMTESQQRSDVPAVALAAGTYALVVALLLLQPDVGQAVLISVVWGILLFSCGLSLRWLGVLSVLGAGAMTVAYFTLSHVRRRIDAFIDPVGTPAYQVGKARQSFVEGAWFGRGPGEGTVKFNLPDAHTDFVIAVIAEEYGALACLALLGLFVFIAVRAWMHLWSETNPFVRNGVLGLVSLFMVQMLINVGVNLGLLPAKGMTLPFVSYGGSSMVGLAITMGMVLALTRRRPGRAYEVARER